MNAFDVVFAATSMSAMLNDIEYFSQIGRQDEVASRSRSYDARNAMFAARQRTRKLQARIAAETEAIRVRTDQQHAVAAELISSQQQLATARSTETRHALVDQGRRARVRRRGRGRCRRESAALAAKIQAAQRTAAPASGSSGNGTVGLGLHLARERPDHEHVRLAVPRQRRLLVHPGLDIGVPAGTPIHAAASGTVIFTGWMGGYGNLTLSTTAAASRPLYGHQSSIAVGTGPSCRQGQVIGYVGCTGYCFGAHLHFEVRVNGSPVDPLGYL